MDAETERILNMTSQSAFRDFFSSGHNAFATFEAARDAALSRAQKLKSENALLRDQNGSLEGMLANSRKTAQELLKENLAFKEGVMKNEKLVNQVIEANVQIEAEAARQVASAEAEATKTSLDRMGGSAGIMRRPRGSPGGERNAEEVAQEVPQDEVSALQNDKSDGRYVG